MEDNPPTPVIPPAESTGMLDRAKDFANKLKPAAAIDGTNPYENQHSNRSQTIHVVDHPV